MSAMSKKGKISNCLDLEYILSAIPKIVALITLSVYIYKASRYAKTHMRGLMKHLFVTKSHQDCVEFMDGLYGRSVTRSVTKFLGLVKVKEEVKADHRII